jgi:uncharacterized protein
MEEDFFEKLREKVLPYFENKDGHGFDHVERVYRLALKISEGEDVDMDVVRAAVLLHDVARSRETRGNSVNYGGDVCHAKFGAEMAGKILKDMGFPLDKIDSAVYAVRVHRSSDKIKAETREAEILQDADRLDALGAIIIVRMIEASSKWEGRVYDPSIPIREEYDGSKSSVINHIYEKILKMTPESFHTSKAREIARGRYDFVKEFAERYVGEVEGRM